MDHAAHFRSVQQGRAAMKFVQTQTDQCLTLFRNAADWAADLLDSLGLEPEGTDRVRRVLGVGGSEFVYSKKIEELAVGDLKVADFEIQIGAMNYGFPLDGIGGMDFLLATQVIIDLRTLEIRNQA
jgi:hypothetical protein